MLNQVIIPTIPNSSIHISGYARPAKQDAVFPLHVHNEFEMLRIYGGKTIFYVYDTHYVVEEGDIIFVNSLVPHKTQIFKDSRAFFVQFSVDISSDDQSMHLSKYLSRFINFDNESVVVIKKGNCVNDQISILLESIRVENFEKKHAYDEFIKADIHKIIAILFRNKIVTSPYSFFKSENISKIAPVLEYIDSHYSEVITLSDLAELLNVNESYLCRMFKKSVNTSVVQYLNFVRVCKAEKMLLSTDKGISEIALETGFSSVSYFNRIFKKHKFITPSMYKKIKYEPGV